MWTWVEQNRFGCNTSKLFLNPSEEEGMTSKLQSPMFKYNRVFVREIEACMWLKPCPIDSSKLWSSSAFFKSRIRVATKKIVRDLLHRKGIEFGNLFLSILLFFWSHLDLLIGKLLVNLIGLHSNLIKFSGFIYDGFQTYIWVWTWVENLCWSLEEPQ